MSHSSLLKNCIKCLHYVFIHVMYRQKKRLTFSHLMDLNSETTSK